MPKKTSPKAEKSAPPAPAKGKPGKQSKKG
jgi:hypothetical protein